MDRNDVPFSIAGVSTGECPVSAITRSSSIYLETFVRLLRMKETTGGTWDVMNADARLVDAMEVCESELSRVDRERREIEHPSR